MSRAPKIAFAHDWLNGMRGGEKCLEALCESYPEAPIYTLFHEKGRVSEAIARHPIVTSRLQRFPKVFERYRYYLPFYAGAMKAMKAKKADVVLSFSHCAAKAVRKEKGALHVCYCFTPARYAWGFFHEYFGGMNVLARWMVSMGLKRFRKTDLASNEDVDHFVAISRYIRDRILRHYHRDAEVIYPPADTVYFVPDARVGREDFYLVVSALVPYKKIDVAVKAFNKNGKRLIVIGDGPDRKKLEKRAGKDIAFLGWQPDAVLRDHFRRAKALIFPGEEDFGIVPVEAQACGCPVIALGRGGALETVIEGETGLFFRECDERSLNEAVARFERHSFEAEAARRNAERFSKERFVSEMKNMLQRQMFSRGRR